MKEKTAIQIANALVAALDAHQLSAEAFVEALMAAPLPATYKKLFRSSSKAAWIGKFKKLPEPDEANLTQILAMFEALRVAPDKMRALLHIARTVRRQPRDLSEGDVRAATAAGATDGDVQLAVLIAAAFSMFNRMVDGLRARTAPSPEAYEARAAQIAVHGYSHAPPVGDAVGHGDDDRSEGRSR